MDVTLLCIGDVVGSPGRRALRDAVPAIVAERNVDCVIANAENIAGGSGITAALYAKVLRCGVHAITLGDHIYRRRDIIPVLESSDRMVRPANYLTGAPGKEFVICETASGRRVAVVSLMGRMYMKPPTNCAFAAIDRVLAAIPKDIKIIVVDMHAEVTSEKVAMGWHVDGRVSVLFGTHTHIPTADERVLEKGTAYITDLGMTGVYDSVLGRDKKRVVATMRTGIPNTFDVADGEATLSGIVVTVDGDTGKAKSIERVAVNAGAETNGL